MKIYFPFLKLKQNEILCIEALSEETRSKIRPFFDVPRTSKNQVAEEILDRLRLGLQKMTKLRKSVGEFEFYIDNFDLDDDVYLEGVPQYRYIINIFKDFRAIPVLALDRHADHNNAVLDYLDEVGGSVAVRLQMEDLESWNLAKKSLTKLWAELTSRGVLHVDLIVDARLVVDYQAAAAHIVEFLKKFRATFPVRTLIVTGSSIPSNINELVKTGEEKTFPRLEYHLWLEVVSNPDLQDLSYGDYGVVSPEYSDVEFEPELFRSISSPRAFYSFEDKFMAVRGVSFKSHPLGNGQYFEIATKIQTKPYFRGAAYSYGDHYIHQRSLSSAALPSKAGNPGSWVKSTLASHITYLSDILSP